MNVIVIPSWYPSDDNPLVGLFIKEQVLSMAKKFPDDNFGISLWGSNDQQLLIQKTDHLKNLFKISQSKESSKTELLGNCYEYLQPAYTWTRKIRRGNIKGIIKANMENIEKFELRFGKADLIHAHVGHPAGFVAHGISQGKKVPYIITEHMSPFPMQGYRSGKLLSGCLIKAYSESLKNIAVSTHLQSSMQHYGVKNLTTIPNMTDETFFVPGKPATNREEGFIFFSLGRLEQQKGIKDLIKAFEILLKMTEKKIHLRIGGDGSLGKELEGLSKEMGLTENITWLGELDRYESLTEFQGSDAFVLTSHHESFGIVLAEAMACGKPVLATSCGGPKDIVDGTCGILTKMKNPEALANDMLKMIGNYDQFDTLKIRQNFENRFSSNVVSEKIMDVYKEIINS